MSGTGIAYFDPDPTREEMASETKLPPPPARRDRQADAAAWQSYIDAMVKRSEQRTMRAAMAAVGQVLKEEREKHRTEICELRALVAALERRCEVLEERQPRSPLRAVIERGAA